MIRLDWSSPKLTIEQVELLVEPMLGTNYDGLLIEGNYLYIRSFEPISGDLEQSIRDSYYSAANIPLKTELSGLAIQSSGELKVSTVPPEGSSVFLVSHDFCDKTTWWGESVRQTSEELEANLLGLTYTADHQYWIDLSHGKVPYEDSYVNTYKPIIYVDDVEVTTGFTINYEDGTVIFDSSKIGHTVKATYSYANGSNWTVTPATGKTLRMMGCEIKISKNVQLSSDQYLVFQILVNGYAVSTMRYKTTKDLVKCTVGNYQIVPAFGGLTHDIIVLPYQYLTVKDLKSTMNMSVKIGVSNNQPLPGDWCGVSVGCLSLPMDQ